MLYYQEIFSSIQGESSDSGFPCVFVRLFGCPVKCVYCDTVQKACTRKRISAENMVDLIQRQHIPNVCITGGEPLIQPEIYAVIYELVRMDYKVSIETSGCVPIDNDLYNRSFKYVMDVKCPSSGVADKNILSNIAVLQMVDEIKFVIADEKDYLFARNVIWSNPTPAQILFSPMFDRDGKPMIGRKLVDWMLRDRLLKARVQVQMHKIIGVK